MDAEADREVHVHRKAIVATLLFSGLRISECCDLRWRHVDLANERLTAPGTKTEAANRKVKIRGALRDVLVAINPADDAHRDRYVFATKTGGRMNPSNVCNRLLAPAEKRASAFLVERGLDPLPHITPHSCRRTFASVLYALGETPPVVKYGMGHKDAALTLNVYAKVMDRSDAENAQLRALVDGSEWGLGSSLASKDHTKVPENA